MRTARHPRFVSLEARNAPTPLRWSIPAKALAGLAALALLASACSETDTAAPSPESEPATSAAPEPEPAPESVPEETADPAPEPEAAADPCSGAGQVRHRPLLLQSQLRRRSRSRRAPPTRPMTPNQPRRRPTSPKGPSSTSARAWTTPAGCGSTAPSSAGAAVPVRSVCPRDRSARSAPAGATPAA